MIPRHAIINKYCDLHQWYRGMLFSTHIEIYIEDTKKYYYQQVLWFTLQITKEYYYQKVLWSTQNTTVGFYVIDKYHYQLLNTIIYIKIPRYAIINKYYDLLKITKVGFYIINRYHDLSIDIIIYLQILGFTIINKYNDLHKNTKVISRFTYHREVSWPFNKSYNLHEDTKVCYYH